jgi:hypothetical protein
LQVTNSSIHLYVDYENMQNGPQNWPKPLNLRAPLAFDRFALLRFSTETLTCEEQGRLL